MRYPKIILPISIIFFYVFLGGSVIHAQEMSRDEVNTVKAKVLEITKEETKQIPGLSITSIYQTIKVKILEGDEEGQVKTIENDYLKLKVGEVFTCVTQ